MRLKLFAAAMLAIATLGLGWPQSTEAGPRVYNHGPGFSYKRAAHARGYPVADPYFYRAEPRGYYPYYNSHYWRPARELRKARRRYKLPRYYKAWGYPKKRYSHRAWHERHHGRHGLGHW